MCGLSNNKEYMRGRFRIQASRRKEGGRKGREGPSDPDIIILLKQYWYREEPFLPGTITILLPPVVL